MTPETGKISLITLAAILFMLMEANVSPLTEHTGRQITTEMFTT